MIWYQMLRPFCYLTIKNANKTVFDLWAPLALGSMSAIGIAVLPERPQIYLTNGVLSQIGSMIQNLPGFYIAALAAIATFQQASLDMLMAKPTPSVATFVNGKWIEVQLTRRRMLTLLFGYLSALSFIIYLAIIAANAIAPSVRAAAGEAWRAAVSIPTTTVLMFLIWHMLCVTLFGLYQLSDRIFQPDPS